VTVVATIEQRLATGESLARGTFRASSYPHPVTEFTS
jgi:hypothetical protein